MNLECTICMESCPFLKYLSCRHAFCLDCLKRLKKTSMNESRIILCPMDRKETTMSALEDETSLQTKLGIMLICDDCCEENPIGKTWYCKNCEVTCCRYLCTTVAV